MLCTSCKIVIFVLGYNSGQHKARRAGRARKFLPTPPPEDFEGARVFRPQRGAPPHLLHDMHTWCAMARICAHTTRKYIVQVLIYIMPEKCCRTKVRQYLSDIIYLYIIYCDTYKYNAICAIMLYMHNK